MWIILNEGIRMFKRRVQILFNKNNFIKKYSGNHLKICEQIIEDCWDKKNKFFMTSNGHFRLFYTRDFTYNIESLIKLGHKNRCVSTLNYALNCFKKKDHITTSINPKGKAFDFPKYTPESLALILYCLTLVNNKELIKKNKEFLQKEINYIYKRSVDKKTGLITKKEYYLSCRDHIKRTSSCYDNVMLGLMSNSINKLKLENPLSKYNYEKLLVKHFWKNDCFIDDLSGLNDITGDANSAPFKFLLKPEKYPKHMKQCIKKIQELKLDKPFPIKYSQRKDAKISFIEKIFSQDYESDSIWPHVAYNYINAVLQFDKKLAKKYLLQYKKQIEKYKTFPEIYARDGKIYKTSFYFCDEAMLWAANHLAFCKELKIN